MKDIYLDMNSQNILKFYGTRLDAKLDSSEFYDYEITKVANDYNTDVLDLYTPIVYESLKIDQNLTNLLQIIKVELISIVLNKCHLKMIQQNHLLLDYKI